MFDPKLPKKLTIYATTSYPSWQEKYIDLVRDEFEKTKLTNDKDLIGRVSKMGESKKAIPFVQGLKKRLTQEGEGPDQVFGRQLGFDELHTLMEMAAGLKRTTGCRQVDIVAVENGGKAGKVVLAEHGVGNRREGLPPPAEAAVPGSPGFYFENVEA